MTRSINLNVLLLVFAVSASAGLARTAIAEQGEQSSDSYRFDTPKTFHQPIPTTPVGFGFTHSHSSTAAEGYLRGKAAVIDAVGSFLLAESQAAILFEQARSLDQQNDVNQTKALHAQQALWREARDAKRIYREKRLAEGRAKLAARKAAVHQAVYRLSPTDVNVATGEIRWPAALKAAKFNADRQRVEQLFRGLVGYQQGQPNAEAEIVKLIEALRRGVQDDIRTLNRDEYLATQKFLVGLALEVGNQQG